MASVRGGETVGSLTGATLSAIGASSASRLVETAVKIASSVGWIVVTNALTVAETHVVSAARIVSTVGWIVVTNALTVAETHVVSAARIAAKPHKNVVARGA